jgi:hypothetical protein
MASAAVALPGTARRLFALEAEPAAWRTFEVTTSVQVLNPRGATRIWLPAALTTATPFQKTIDNDFKAEGGTAKMMERGDGADRLGIIAAEFPAGVKPMLTATSRVATRDYTVDLGSGGYSGAGFSAANRSIAGGAPKADRQELELFLQPTKMLPTDGIVKTKST